jgi:hypothetical protein
MSMTTEEAAEMTALRLERLKNQVRRVFGFFAEAERNPERTGEMLLQIEVSLGECLGTIKKMRKPEAV